MASNRKKRPPNKYDNAGKRLKYEELFLGWIASGVTLNAFCKAKEIDYDTVRVRSIDGRWKEKRLAMEARALKKALKKLEQQKQIDFEKHIIANDDLLGFIRRKLKAAQKPMKDADGKAMLDDDGKPKTKGLSAFEIKQFAEALEKNAKLKSFMAGGPTERTEEKSLNLHADVADIAAEFRENTGQDKKGEGPEIARE